MAMKTAPKTWFPTKYTHLYRNKSGTYYARLSLAGKQTWRSLKTSTLSIAKAELDELLKVADHAKEVSQSGQFNHRITGAEAIASRRAQIDNDASLKPNSRKYYHEVIAAFEKQWPAFLTAELRNLSEEDCEHWAGANKNRMSANRFNNALSLLKSLFEIAIKKGARRLNPATGLKRMKVPTKDLSSILPTRQQFAQFFASIRDAGGRFSRACADLVEFLAYTGMRKGEVRWVQWRHCNFDRAEIHIVGDPTDATKNGERRRIPMIQAARELLLRMQQSRQTNHPSAPVLLVHEAQKAMDRAFKQLGMERFTHHDLRHYFATVCIESGVDIPTVSRWLGHKDGGALAMRTYGHLRNEHSLAAASKVSFAP